MAKKERPTWFRVFLHQKTAMEMVPREVLGEVLLAAMNYFEFGTEPQLDPLGMILFASFKASIDESFDDYQARVRNAKNAYLRKKGWVSSGDDSGSLPTYTETNTKNNHNIYTDTQADTQAETDTQTQADTKLLMDGLSDAEKCDYWRKRLSSPEELQKDAAFLTKAASHS